MLKLTPLMKEHFGLQSPEKLLTFECVLSRPYDKYTDMSCTIFPTVLLGCQGDATHVYCCPLQRISHPFEWSEDECCEISQTTISSCNVAYRQALGQDIMPVCSLTSQAAGPRWRCIMRRLSWSTGC